MLRSGAWAVPLPCDAPVLVAWTRFTDRAHAAACALPGVTCATPATAADLCREWTPLAIGTSVLTVLVVLACAVISALRPLRWCALVLRSAVLTVLLICSARTPKETARAAGGMQPLPPREELAPPLLCAVCFRRTRLGSDLKVRL